jgi:hypothetical protein
METKQWELEEIKVQNSNAFTRIGSLCLALKDLEAFERAVLAGGKNFSAPQTLRRLSRRALHPNHAN